MFVLHWPLCSVSVLLLVFATFTLSFLVACLWFLPNFEWGPSFPMWQVVLWVGAPTIGQELAVMVNFVCQLDKPCGDQIKYYVWYFQMRLAFESVNSVK